MTRTRRRWLVNAGMALVLLAVVGLTVRMLGGSESASASSQVRTVAARVGTVTATVTADGQVEPVQQVAANFGASGTVTTLKTSVGASVVAGQVLATVDPSDAERQLAVAEASLDSAEAALESAESGTSTTTPGANGAAATTTTTVNEAQVAQAEAQVLQAQAGVEDAEAAVAGTVLKAPITGMVLQVNGRIGSSVAAGGSSSAGTSNTTGSTGAQGGTATSGGSSSSDFIVVADATALQVSVSFSESDIASLEVGQAARISYPALTDVSSKGTITSIDPNASVTSNVVTYGAVVRITTAPDQLRLGQSATVTVTTGSVTDAVIVPTWRSPRQDRAAP